MVMEASGRSERKYCHCRGGGQRLMRTSRRLMERSTDRLTTTGTNSEPPCCRVACGKQGAQGLLLSRGDMFTWVMIPEFGGQPGRSPETSNARCPDTALAEQVAPVSHL